MTGAALAAAAENVLQPPSVAPAAVAPRFVALGAIDFAAILPVPPGSDSLAGQAALATVLQVQALVWAELLAEMVPERRGELLTRAERAAWGRVMGGVHFPTDIVAGRRLAPVMRGECRKNADFRAAFTAARAEVRAVAGLPCG